MTVQHGAKVKFMLFIVVFIAAFLPQTYLEMKLTHDILSDPPVHSNLILSQHFQLQKSMYIISQKPSLL